MKLTKTQDIYSGKGEVKKPSHVCTRIVNDKQVNDTVMRSSR